MACRNVATMFVTTDYGVFNLCDECRTAGHMRPHIYIAIAPVASGDGGDAEGYVPPACQCEHISHFADQFIPYGHATLATVPTASLEWSIPTHRAEIERRERLRIDPHATEAAIQFLDTHRVASQPLSTTAWRFLNHASERLNVELREYFDGKRDAYPEPAKGIGEPPDGFRYPITSAESQHYIETGEWPAAERVYYAIYLLDRGTHEAFETHFFCSEPCAVAGRAAGLHDGDDCYYSAITKEPVFGICDGTRCEHCDQEIR